MDSRLHDARAATDRAAPVTWRGSALAAPPLGLARVARLSPVVVEQEMRPFSAPVTSITASSIASRSSSSSSSVISFSLNSKSLRTPASCWLAASQLRVASARASAGRAALRSGRACAARLVEHAEASSDVAEREPVAVNQTRAALLLAVDEDLGLLVDLFEVEVAPVEEDLRVRLGERRRSGRARRCRARGRWS